MKLYHNLDFEFITFDFDGVIIDSNQRKESALVKVISDVFGLQLEVVNDFLKSNSGRNREFYFRYFLPDANMANNKKNELLTHLNELFSECVKDIYLNSTLEPSLKLLRELMPKSSWYILSSANSVEILEILKKRDIGELFNGVYGGPKTKVENFNNYIKPLIKLNTKVLHIGDGNQDIRLINEVGIKGLLLTNWSMEPDLLLKQKYNINYVIESTLLDFVNNLKRI